MAADCRALRLTVPDDLFDLAERAADPRRTEFEELVEKHPPARAFADYAVGADLIRCIDLDGLARALSADMLAAAPGDTPNWKPEHAARYRAWRNTWVGGTDMVYCALAPPGTRGPTRYATTGAAIGVVVEKGSVARAACLPRDSLRAYAQLGDVGPGGRLAPDAIARVAAEIGPWPARGMISALREGPDIPAGETAWPDRLARQEGGAYVETEIVLPGPVSLDDVERVRVPRELDPVEMLLRLSRGTASPVEERAARLLTEVRRRGIAVSAGP